MMETKTMMKVMISVMLLVLLALPAKAELELEYAGPVKTETEVSPPVVLFFPPLERKPRFKDKHPKLYRVYRGARHACVLTKPFIEVGGAVAQIVLVFI